MRHVTRKTVATLGLFATIICLGEMTARASELTGTDGKGDTCSIQVLNKLCTPHPDLTPDSQDLTQVECKMIVSLVFSDFSGTTTVGPISVSSIVDPMRGTFKYSALGETSQGAVVRIKLSRDEFMPVWYDYVAPSFFGEKSLSCTNLR